ncbi:MAG: flavodoxin family protein [Desulfobacter sp.]|nr:flavodoxin family protein [Desulfobacter sp.]WDP87846.1 MAG: flavodoxin family protein [Desulfobacter sp.]
MGEIVKPKTMTPSNKILGVGGSPRQKGNSDILLNTIIHAAAEEKTQCRSVQLRDVQFQGCIGCEKCRKDKICTGLTDGMSLIYNGIISSQGLVLVSPTHNYNITSWMKAFIDRLYCFYNFQKTHPRAWSSQFENQNRKAVVVAVCEQENKKDMGFTIEAMKLPLEALGYEVIEELSVFKVFEKARVKKDTATLERASNIGKRLAKSISQ